MSITSLISPSGTVSAQDDLWHIASSNNSGQTDFKFVFDVFKGSDQLVRVKLYPDVDTGKGYFNAASVVKNEFTFDWFTPVDDGMFLTEIDNSITYNIRVGEDLTGTTTLNMASGNVTVYNWTPPLFKRRQNDITDKRYKFLTNRPLTIRAGINDKILIPTYQSASNIQFRYKIYEGNTLIDEDSGVPINYLTKDFCQLDIGFNAFNESTGNIIPNTITSYKIQLYNPVDEFSEWVTVNLECNPLYETINLHFINQYGMFDTARFSKASRLNMNTERKSYQQKEYDFKTSSVEYYDANKVYKESKINFNTKSNWTYKLTMDFPTDEEYTWLSELINTPQVYAEIDGDYYPVTLTANNYEYSKNINNGLRVFEIDIELNQTRNGFRR